MSSKNANQILDKAVIRCKKAQALARRFNTEKKVKAGATVQQKMVQLIKMTKDNEYGELTAELQTLDNMIANMQRAVLERLLESVETIERRMKSYQKTILKAEFNDSTSTATSTAFPDNEDDTQILSEETDDNMSSDHPNDETTVSTENADRWNDTDDEVMLEIIAMQRQRFMDRLRNFFSFQRIAEERLGIIDPQGKIAAMKVKPHTRGGIKEKDGTYKSCYRQQDIEGKPIRYLSDLYIAARDATSEFQSVMNSLRHSIPGLTSSDVEVSPIKRRSRAAKKAHEKYSYRKPGPAEAWLYDILRGSVYCKSYKQMHDVNKYLKENVHIVDCSNRFAVPQFDGYRDIMYYISVPYKNEKVFICEIQVHHIEFKRHYGVNSHRAHLRPYFANISRDPVQLLHDLEILMKVGHVDDNLMEFLLEASDPNQLKLFARIFFEELGETQKALELFERVVAMEELTSGERSLSMGATYIYLGRILLKLGDTDGALSYLREAVANFTDTLGSEHPQVATTLVIIGDVYSSRGNFNEALLEQQNALEIREESLGGDHALVAESYITVAKAQCDQGNFKEGMAKCRTALKIQESIIGDNNVEVIRLYSTIGAIFCLEREYKKAIEFYNKALSMQEKLYGKKHQQIAETLTEIGNLKMKENEYAEAEMNHQKALRIREMILGKWHPDCAISHGNIGVLKCRKGDKEEGLAILRLALKLTMKAFGKYHLLTSNCFAEIGSVMIKSNDHDDAIGQYKDCLAVRKRLYGKTHPKYAETLNTIGHIETLKGNYESAVTTLSKALIILGKVVGYNHPRVADTYEYLGKAYESQMNHIQALDFHTKSLAIRSSVLGKQHPATVSSCFAIAGVLEQKRDFTGAKMAYRQALLACLSLRGEIHIDTAHARLRLGKVLNRGNEYKAAEEELRKVLSIREEIRCTDDLQTAEACSLLGTALNQQNKFEEALSFHEKAQEIQNQQLGEDSPLVPTSLEAIAKLTESK